MLLTSDTPVPTARLSRHESVFMLVLILTLVLAVSTFFAPFAMGAALLGLLLSVLLHRSALIDDVLPGVAEGTRMPIINVAAIHIGADAGGLIFVGGSIAILALGLPVLRWFAVMSIVAALVVAAIRVAWPSSQ